MQPATSAYPPSLLQSRGSLILAACVFFLVFVSLKDYREENKSFLRSHGVEDETIEQAVPKTARERYAEQKALAEKQKYADSALGALVKIAHSQRSTWPSTLTSEEEIALEKWLEYATEKIPKVEG
ncbi:hypothetical protein TrVE_jg4914 [Triparma verrucosa]|uniref:Uncharacterized protein n=2 Tax=Triparma TaxID=722752 RepID=A0A9W7ELF6_9STRA|nr:hypothetical protein TrST_g445 [Triparma strigata]GMH94440.1 hypothetical protein TrVE_jg4914 [Triparma verrucosa]|mmetsp:Transcript_27240/g.51609  ORF Transcript_27240/g.51609 Transcript_27240/m.51609 type:complete len:126 (+) Transcript_27240:269-646(+)